MTRMKADRGTGARWGAGAVLAVLGVVLHLPALRGWWKWNDPHVLLHAFRVSTPRTLFDPAAYRELFNDAFTPLLPISFKLDLILAGLNPAVAYAHQLAALLVAGLLLDQLLRRYVDRGISAAITFAFLISWPGIYAARALATRNLVEGSVAACAALLLWSARDAEGLPHATGVKHRIAGAVFWLLALLCSEVFLFVPLLFLLQERANGRTWREASPSLLPAAVAGALWLVWRVVMVGPVVPAADPQSLAALAGVSLGGPVLASGGWIVVVAAVATPWLLVQRGRARGATVALLMLSAAIALLMSLPAGRTGGSFVFAMVVFAGIALMAGASLSGFRGSRTAATLAAIAALFAYPFMVRMYDDLARPIESEGRWVWHNGADAAGLLATGPVDDLRGLRELKNMWSSEGSPPLVGSPAAFAIGGIDPTGWVQWDDEASRMRAVDASAIVAASGPRVPPHAMELAVRRDGEVLSWKFSSEREGRWSFVTLPLFEEHAVPSTGRRRLSPVEADFFVVKTDWSAGGWSASGELPMPADGETTRWTVR